MTIGGDKSGDYTAIHVVAANDFSADDKLGRAVQKSGEFADTGIEAIGVCAQQVDSGQTMSVIIQGLAKYRPIDVVSANYKLTVIESGFFQAAAADTFVVGISLGASNVDFANVNSNALGTAMLNFGTKEYISTISGGDLAG